MWMMTQILVLALVAQKRNVSFKCSLSMAKKIVNLKPQSIYFLQNQANISGSTLFGGLLDRCAVMSVC